MNTFGTLFRLTDFGESHGRAIGGVIDGMPAGIQVDFDALAAAMARRRPGTTSSVSQRKESDEVVFLSGIFEGKTLGTPIGFIIENNDARSADYDNLRTTFRPNHADMTYAMKYGHRDFRGGGRASARETAVRVVGGALASQVLAMHGIRIDARALRIGNAVDHEGMEAEIMQARAEHDSVGGIVACCISGMPAGVGNPVFGKLQAMLASAMLSINAAKGFEYGCGFDGASRRGSDLVDTPYFDKETGRFRTRTNHSGGILGGISTGEDIYFNVAFKPVASINRPLETVDSEGNPCCIEVGGRHDPCVVPRAIHVVEAMTAMTVLDALMMSKAIEF